MTKKGLNEECLGCGCCSAHAYKDCSLNLYDLMVYSFFNNLEEAQRSNYGVDHGQFDMITRKYGL